VLPSLSACHTSSSSSAAGALASHAWRAYLARSVKINAIIASEKITIAITATTGR
jgi:hypothetical protein